MTRGDARAAFRRDCMGNAAVMAFPTRQATKNTTNSAGIAVIAVTQPRNHQQPL